MSNTFKLRKKPEGAVDIYEDHKNFPEEVKKLTALFSEMSGRGDHPLSPITVRNYVQKINRLTVLITGHGYNGSIDFLKNYGNVLEKISASDLSAKKDYMSPVVRLMKHYKFDPELIAPYNKAMASYKQDEDKDRKTNRANAKEKSLAMPLSEILRKIKDFKPENDAELAQKVIVSFYFMNQYFTPRNDLYNMKFVNFNKKPNKMDNSLNYVTVDKNMNPQQIIMNAYKTARTYGRQRFNISEDLKKVLVEYIKSYGKQTGDFVFVDKNGQPFKDSNFRNLLESSMEHIVGVPINIDLVRKIKITDYYSKVHSIGEDERFAQSFLHSTGVQKEYLKVDLFSDE
jgi:hypothetical protein